MLTKLMFYDQKIFQKVSITTLKKSYSSQKIEINQWYKCEEYRSIQKRNAYFENKKKLKDENFMEAITCDFVERIARWRPTQLPVCHYCGLPKSRLSELNHQPSHHNKRWPKEKVYYETQP